MKISWSPLAADRLENIYEYISVDNKAAAQKVVERIFKKVESLAKNPERGRKVPETNREEIRELFESDYRINYRIETKRVSILTIRNFKQILPDKDIK
ncbi:MAG: type II toxin-antitoxin system RelE/ParE family toxin [Ignavibacteriota bacterium]|jgi:plasmid stabilization system protein ParE|nr:type II toxin-antitoxin system RelE/ParE family toxin [Ignavibacteriales bacterium]MBL1123235.1 type II toxin-antitoxin system RelE/ParE family toxin [Ignavibacteriota bacterium]MCZ7615040.1 type II toxin-antitoxin system RelE/ParE family toxin [Ignavibacteriaceae bacterium]NUM62890.1 type II toxin-antitoxin system RelE/ParE family toxin [Ignavibacteriaceae bacterium]QKJ95996.1 MAG: type II toxin-antitoxin system RelE/ParE family toxin [Ignavibacteriota bacterium]